MKQYAPTARRLDKAREEGKVLRSQLFTKALGFAFAGLILKINFQNDIWLKPPTPVKSIEALGDYAYFWILQIGLWTGLFLVPYSIVSTLAECLVGGVKWRFAKKSRSPFDSVTQGFFGLPSHAGRVLPYIFLILVFIWIADYVPDYLAVREIWSSLFKWVSIFALAVMIIGTVELGLCRFRFKKSLSMSLQELRDEIKETDGDPLMKHLRSSLHRSLTYDEAVSRIRKSSVVVVG